MDETQFKARIDQIYSDLEQYTYYELLNLEPDASPDTIRAAFHRMALTMHPDRFHHHPDQELGHKVYSIYKRIAEGYRVLMASPSRKEYDKVLAEGQNRLIQTERKKTGPRREEDAIDNPQAKKFFLLAVAAQRQGNIKGAIMNFKLALGLTGEHPLIQRHLKELQDKG